MSKSENKSKNFFIPSELRNQLERYLNDIYFENREVRHKHSHDESGNDRLVEDLLELVVEAASVFHRKHQRCDLCDLVQIGNCAMIEALERFDETKGVKLSTYVTSCVNNSFYTALRENLIIGAPQRFLRKKENVEKAIDHYVWTFGRHPSEKEIADWTGYSERQIHNVVMNCYSVIHLEDEYQREDESRHDDGWGNNNNHTGVDESMFAEVEEDVWDAECNCVTSALSKLPKGVQKVVKMRYMEGRKLREIAEQEGCSVQNIDKTCKKALLAMRNDILYAMSA